MTKELSPGSISSGTLRPQDLLPKFLFTLEAVDQEMATKYNTELILLGFGYSQCGVCFGEDSPLWEEESETISEIIEDISYDLSDYAPDGYYFGAHPGDGAEFGVWPITDEEE